MQRNYCAYLNTILLLLNMVLVTDACRKYTAHFLHCTMPQFSRREPPVKSDCMKLFPQRNLPDFNSPLLFLKICQVRWGMSHPFLQFTPHQLCAEILCSMHPAGSTLLPPCNSIQPPSTLLLSLFSSLHLPSVFHSFHCH